MKYPELTLIFPELTLTDPELILAVPDLKAGACTGMRYDQLGPAHVRLQTEANFY